MSNGTNESLTKSRAVEVFADDVSSKDVARAYLDAEFPNILGENIVSENGTVEESLRKVTNERLDRLVEAISYSYRMNGVFHAVTDVANDWLDVELPVDAILLTGTEPHINDIVYSPDIGSRPSAFADYLSDYFEEHPKPSDDPQGLNEFRPRTSMDDLRSTRIITVERDGVIMIVDGIHRLVASTLLGAVSVRAFAAIPNGKESVSMKGDSIFLTMRLQYEGAHSDEERKTILDACTLLARDSTDGAKAVQTYWIDHSSSGVMKAAGKDLLTRLVQS